MDELTKEEITTSYNCILLNTVSQFLARRHSNLVDLSSQADFHTYTSW